MGAFLYAPPAPAAIVIRDDGGGLVDSYMNAAARYTSQHRRIEIRGSCRSACTLALAVPKTCVGPGALLKWHHAYNPATGAPVLSVTAQMLGMIPSRVREVIGPNIQLDYSPAATLNYEQLVRLGVNDCDAKPPETFASTSPAREQLQSVDALALSREPTFLPMVRSHR